MSCRPILESGRVAGYLCGGYSGQEIRIKYLRCERCARNRISPCTALRRHYCYLEEWYGWRAVCGVCHPRFVARLKRRSK